LVGVAVEVEDDDNDMVIEFPRFEDREEGEELLFDMAVAGGGDDAVAGEVMKF